MIYESKNGYIIECLTKRWFKLTRKNGLYSNYFYIDGESGQPVFDWKMYVNDTTIKLCKQAYRKFLEADKKTATITEKEVIYES